MAKKDKAPPRREERSAADYYKLNTQAIDDLLNATEENSPEVSEEELRKYRSGRERKTAPWLKISLIKTWFAGMVCFYFMWGLGIYMQDMLDQIFVTGIALGFVWDILVKNLLHFMESTPGENARWMMFSRRGFITLPLNVLYAFLLIFCVYNTYWSLDTILRILLGQPDQAVMGVEPILFGLLVMAWDALLLKMKAVFRQIVADAKKQARVGK